MCRFYAGLTAFFLGILPHMSQLRSPLCLPPVSTRSLPASSPHSPPLPRPLHRCCARSGCRRSRCPRCRTSRLCGQKHFQQRKNSQSSSVKLESKSGCAATTTRRAQQERLMHSTEAGSNNPVSSCSQSLNNELRGSSLPASTRGSRFNPDLWWINMNISLFLPLWWFFAYSRGTARFRKAAQKLSRGFAQWVGKRWRGATPPCFENTFVSSIYQTSKVKNKQINHKYQKVYVYVHKSKLTNTYIFKFFSLETKLFY